MLGDARIDDSEGIDPNQTGGLSECIIYHYWYFLKVKFRFEAKACHSYHDMIQTFMNFDDVAIVSVEVHDYTINIW